ncbi:APC family permease [Ligilactobacillus sp. LYQ60]|uniref:APC family permease n=1 Tax=unclassified Ligilactobacillus TaxID=2767920 RepID=UPI003851D251
MATHKNKLGLLSIILLGVNAIIGSGIFLLPNKAYALVGTKSIFVFIFDALLVITIALCFAEAAGLFSKDGGPYVYTRAAFGDFAGFEVGFIKWIVSMIAWATMANGFATALGQIFPACSSRAAQIIVMTVIIVGLTLINLCGVNSSKIINNLASIGKLVPLVIFIIVGFFFVHGKNFHPATPIPTTSHGFGAACLVIFYAFTGFEAIAVAAEDMHNPQKTLPRAILMVMGVVSIFYLLIQVVAIGVLGNHLATATAPVQTAMEHFLGRGGFALVAAGELISIGGINIASSFITPRCAVALANDNLLPRFILKRNRYGVEYWAIIITGIITLPIALSGSFTTLAAISVVSRFAQYLPTCLAILVFRRTMKDASRPFKIPGGPIIPLIAIVVSIWLLMQATLHELIWGFGGLVIAIPFYFLMKWTCRRPN